MTAPLVVAEVGGNHRGSMQTARRMIEIAGTYCTEHFQLDGSRPSVAVKFQKRTPSLSPSDFERPHPNPHHAYGDSYGAHREALEFSAHQHKTLKHFAEQVGVVYACSVWDVPAAEEIAALNPEWIKVPSAHNLDWPLISWLAEWGGPLHISLGMTTRAEADELVEFLTGKGAAERTTLYHCTSDYPVRTEDVRLDELDVLRARYGRTVAGFGFSGHHDGIVIDMVAAAKGVTHIERHYTLNRTWRGTDHAASLEPDGIRKLIRGVEEVSRARGTKGRDGLLITELVQRKKLKRMVAV